MRVAKISFLAYKQKHEEMVEEKGISNEQCYEMLALPAYKEMLQYAPLFERRSDLPEDNAHYDKLRDFVDYPYLRDD